MKHSVDLVTIIGPNDVELFAQLLISIKQHWKPSNSSHFHIYTHSKDYFQVKSLTHQNFSNLVIAKIHVRENLEVGSDLPSEISQRILKVFSSQISTSDFIWFLDCDFLLVRDLSESDLISGEASTLTIAKFDQFSDRRWIQDSARLLSQDIQYNYMVDGWYVFYRLALNDLWTEISDINFLLFPNFS